MTEKKKIKHEEKSNGVNPVTAGVVGAVVGAGIAIAGAVALSDEENRDKVKAVLADVKEKAANYVEEVKQNVEDTKTGIEDKVTEGKEKIVKAADAAKDSLASK